MFSVWLPPHRVFPSRVNLRDFPLQVTIDIFLKPTQLLVELLGYKASNKIFTKSYALNTCFHLPLKLCNKKRRKLSPMSRRHFCTVFLRTRKIHMHLHDLQEHNISQVMFYWQNSFRRTKFAAEFTSAPSLTARTWKIMFWRWSFPFPIGSMYCIFTIIYLHEWLISMVFM